MSSKKESFGSLFGLTAEGWFDTTKKTYAQGENMTEEEREKEIRFARGCLRRMKRLITRGPQPPEPTKRPTGWVSKNDYAPANYNAIEPIKDEFAIAHWCLLEILFTLNMSFEELFPEEKPLLDLVFDWFEVRRRARSA